MPGERLVVVPPDRESQAPGRLEIRLDPMDTLHLAERVASQDGRILAAEPAELPRRELGQVSRRRCVACSWRDTARLEEGHRLAATLSREGAVTRREARALLVLGHLGRRAPQPDRLQEAALHVGGIRLARGG